MKKTILVPTVAAIGAAFASGCAVYPDGVYAGPAVVVQPAPVVVVGGEGGEGGHHGHKNHGHGAAYPYYPYPAVIIK